MTKMLKNSILFQSVSTLLSPIVGVRVNKILMVLSYSDCSQYLVNLLCSLGNINASLMTLRTCMEILRENQGNAENGISPKVIYRCAANFIQYLNYLH